MQELLQKSKSQMSIDEESIIFKFFEFLKNEGKPENFLKTGAFLSRPYPDSEQKEILNQASRDDVRRREDFNQNRLSIGFFYSQPIVQMGKGIESIVPCSLERLNTDSEYSIIKEELVNSMRKFNIFKEHATIINIHQALKGNSKIIHISCHGKFEKAKMKLVMGKEKMGNSTSSLYFEAIQDLGILDIVGDEDIQMLLRLVMQADEDPRVIIINACQSEGMGGIFSKHFKKAAIITIKNEDTILDSAAIEFTKFFYKCIIGNCSHKNSNTPLEAFNLAIMGIRKGANPKQADKYSIVNDKAEYLNLPVFDRIEPGNVLDGETTQSRLSKHTLQTVKNERNFWAKSFKQGEDMTEDLITLKKANITRLYYILQFMALPFSNIQDKLSTQLSHTNIEGIGIMETNTNQQILEIVEGDAQINTDAVNFAGKYCYDRRKVYLALYLNISKFQSNLEILKHLFGILDYQIDVNSMMPATMLDKLCDHIKSSYSKSLLIFDKLDDRNDQRAQLVLKLAKDLTSGIESIKVIILMRSNRPQSEILPIIKETEMYDEFLDGLIVSDPEKKIQQDEKEEDVERGAANYDFIEEKLKMNLIQDISRFLKRLIERPNLRQIYSHQQSLGVEKVFTT